MTPRCSDRDQSCPVDPCPGQRDPSACDHWASLSTWRRVSPADQVARTEAAPRNTLDPRVRDAVLACPDRGSVLPVSMQADCGCLGVEWTECRAGRGRIAGRVSLRDCLTCQATHLGRGG